MLATCGGNVARSAHAIAITIFAALDPIRSDNTRLSLRSETKPDLKRASVFHIKDRFEAGVTAISAPRLSKTPIRESALANAQFGSTLFVKDETVQPGGSFKYRGALIGVHACESGIVAAGSGNFPIAVGLAARRLNKPALLVVANNAPAFKIEQVRQTGADVVLKPPSELARFAEIEAQHRNWKNLHPFESSEMIEGGFALGEELTDSICAMPLDQDAVFVACGGGGLAGGLALALRKFAPRAKLIVVEPSSHRRYWQSLANGAPTSIDPEGATICDALLSRRMGSKSFEALLNFGADAVAVEDTDISAAQRVLRDFYGIISEPSGAAAMAAALAAKHTGRTWAIVCGGNIAPFS